MCNRILGLHGDMKRGCMAGSRIFEQPRDCGACNSVLCSIGIPRRITGICRSNRNKGSITEYFDYSGDEARYTAYCDNIEIVGRVTEYWDRIEIVLLKTEYYGYIRIVCLIK